MMKAHRIVGGSHRPPPDQGHRPGSNSAVPPDRAEPPNPLRRELRLRPRFRAREPPGPATARAASQAQVHRKTGEAQPGPSLGVAAPERARPEEHTSELQSLMRTSYAVICFKH